MLVYNDHLARKRWKEQHRIVQGIILFPPNLVQPTEAIVKCRRIRSFRFDFVMFFNRPSFSEPPILKKHAVDGPKNNSISYSNSEDLIAKGKRLKSKYLVKKLGQGNFGTVFECQDVDTGKLVACKKLSIKDGKAMTEGELMAELAKPSKSCKLGRNF